MKNQTNTEPNLGKENYFIEVPFSSSFGLQPQLLFHSIPLSRTFSTEIIVCFYVSQNQAKPFIIILSKHHGYLIVHGYIFVIECIPTSTSALFLPQLSLVSFPPTPSCLLLGEDILLLPVSVYVSVSISISLFFSLTVFPF